MSKERVDYEVRFYLALKRITAYMTSERLRRQADREYGLSYEEALEFAYDNIQGEALSALKGYRRKRQTPKPATSEAGEARI